MLGALVAPIVGVLSPIVGGSLRETGALIVANSERESEGDRGEKKEEEEKKNMLRE